QISRSDLIDSHQVMLLEYIEDSLSILGVRRRVVGLQVPRVKFMTKAPKQPMRRHWFDVDDPCELELLFCGLPPAFHIVAHVLHDKSDIAELLKEPTDLKRSLLRSVRWRSGPVRGEVKDF